MLATTPAMALRFEVLLSYTALTFWRRTEGGSWNLTMFDVEFISWSLLLCRSFFLIKII